MEIIVNGELRHGQWGWRFWTPIQADPTQELNYVVRNDSVCVNLEPARKYKATANIFFATCQVKSIELEEVVCNDWDGLS